MSYSNITVVTAQGTYGYELGTSISYNTLDLIADIPHDAQLEIERIFSTDRNGLTATIPNFLNDVNVSVVDKQKVFLIPVSRCTFNTATKQITAVNLPASGNQVYNFTYIPISGANVGIPQTIAVPALQAGDNIIVRRKTVSNTPLVQWVPGSKLTTAQLNLNTLQMLYLIQEILNKVTIVSISTEQILDNAITSPKILNKAVTFSKLQDLSGPLKLLGSGSDPINFQDVREMSVGPGFDVVGNVIDVKPIANGQRNDINVVAANSDWRINPNAVTYAKMQTVAAANRVLGSTTAGGAVSEVQVNTNMLADNAVTFAKMQSVAENVLIGRTTGAGNLETIALSSAGRELINDASVPDMRQTLGLGSAALSASTDFATAVHTHGNLTSDGRLGSTSGLPVVTTTNGAITTGTFGTTGGTFAQGNDARFSDARTPLAHTHPISDVVNLQTNLDAKSNVGHTHVIGDVTNLQTSLNNKADAVHTHTIAQVTNLQSSLDGKSNLGHTHTISEVTNLQTSLDGKAATSHSHAISDVTGLQTALDGKAASTHTHSIAQVTNLQTSLDGKANTLHSHVIADTTGLQAALDAKLDDSQATAFGLSLLGDADAAEGRATLGLNSAATQPSSAFAAASHTHTLSNITDAGSAAFKNAPAAGVNATTSQVVMGDDTRLTNARTPVAHTHAIGDITNLQQSLDAKVDDTQISAFGLTLIDDANAAAAQATLGLGSAATQPSSAFAAASHTHGNISNTGTIGTTANLPIITGTGGALVVGSFGTTANTFCQGNDSRLSDSRTPVSHVHSTSDITSGTLDIARIPTGTTASTVCVGNDSRLSDARTPVAHTHVIADTTGLQDALNGKASTTHTHAVSDITSGTLGISRGGTGLSSTPTNGQILIGNNSGFSLATITAGTNIAISNSPGGITISQVGEPVAPSAILANGTYGDITISGNTWTIVNDAVTAVKIANDQVTFAKLQNIATNKLLGRATAGSGDVEEIDLTAAGRALLDDADAAAQRTTLGLGTSATLNVAVTGDAASGEVVRGNDSRLTNARTPTAHVHAAGDITSGTLDIARIPTGTTVSTVCIGNDSRLSDARTPTAHVHGNITNAGAIGSTPNLPIITGTSGVLQTSSFGTTANTFCQGNDSRLSDSRTPLAHTHTISNVTNLQESLDAKVDDSQISAFGLTLVDDVDAAAARTTLGLGTAATEATTAFAAASHTHTIANVTGLQNALDNKVDDSQISAFALTVLDDTDAASVRSTLGLGTAATSASTAFAAASHTHAIGDVSNLQASLDAKANTVHSHAISDVTNLQTTLDGKTNVGHTHTIANITSLQTTLDGKSNVGHTHAISDVTGLQTALNGKAATSHTHVIGDVTNLQSTLDAKLNSSSVSSFMLTVLDDATAAAAQATLGLGSAATQASTAFAAASHTHNTNDIVDDAITYAKIQNVVTANRVLGSTTAGGPVAEVEVQTAMIANSAVTEAKIATDAVTTNKILNANVTEAKIANGAVTSDKIASGAITYGKLPTMVTANRLLGGTAAGATISEVQVNTNMVLDNAITTAKIADANVTSGKLASGVAAANLGTGGVTASLLATDAVTTLKILDLNVTSSKIANNAITNGKLRTSAATSVIGRSTNTVGEVADIIAGTDGHVLRRNAGVLEFGPVTSVDIAANSISYDKLANMVTTNRVLGSSAVGGAISATQVTSGMIADGAVTAAKLAGDLVIPVANLPAETKYTFVSANGLISNSEFTFTNIPTNAKRITVVFWNLKRTSSTTNINMQVGGATLKTSGYVCTATRMSGTGLNTNTSTTALNIFFSSSVTDSETFWGKVVLDRVSPISSNKDWVYTATGTDAGNREYSAFGAAGLGTDSLTQIRIFLNSGTFSGTGGTVSLYYEV